MAGFEIHDFDFNKLIQFASKAKGDVFLETPDGDVLNLKSRLTQLLALSSAILTEASMSFLGLSHKDVYKQIVVVQIGATSAATIVGMVIAMILG